jgi:hypothetical protein
MDAEFWLHKEPMRRFLSGDYFAAIEGYRRIDH